MALINCPECSKEISDKVKSCPHCGYPLVKDETQKVEVTSVNLKVDKSKQMKIITAAIGIIAIIAIIIGSYSLNDQEQYSKDLNAAVDEMMDSGSTAEDLLNLTGSVWSNAIEEESDPETDPYTQPDGFFVSDFNEALENMYADSDVSAQISDIESSQDKVASLMKELKNPPDKFKASYETLLEMYNAYQSVTDFAVSPEGTLVSFQTSRNDRVDKMVSLYKKLQAQLPE